MKKERPEVLVCVLKTKRDRELLLNKKWYRIPLKHAPRRRPEYLAFYQPLTFEKKCSKIKLYGRVKFWRLKKRKELLPEEKKHVRAEQLYLQFFLSRVTKLRRALNNKKGVRISFGFTSLHKLRHSPDVRRLFNIPPIEDILAKILKKNKIPYYPQFRVRRKNRKIYRMDFALPCRKGWLNVECDGFRWHTRKQQRLKDRRRDKELRKLGWKILRLPEEKIVKNPQLSFRKVRKILQKLGGSHPELPLKIKA